MSGEELDEMGAPMDVIYHDGEPLRIGEKERDRDLHRWELDPASAEDYADRTRPSMGALPILKMGHVDRYH